MATADQLSHLSSPAPWVRRRARGARDTESRVGSALGWVGVGLGVAQLAAPDRVASWIGLRENDATTRWTLRVVGALSSVLGAAALARGGSLAEANGGGGISVIETISIRRSREDVYAFFRDLENLPRFMAHLEHVRVNNGKSHWRAKGPLNSSIEWDAEIVEDRPGELLAWRSLPSAEVPNWGSVQFKSVSRADGNEWDTEVIVELEYRPPAGALGRAVAKLFGEEPSQQISSDLRRLKQMLEIGEVLHSDASVHRAMHPAQPPRELPKPQLREKWT